MKKAGVALLIGPAAVWLMVGLILPVAAVISASFLSRGSHGEILYDFTTDQYLRVLDPIYLWPVLRSLSLALCVTVTSLLLSLPLSFFIAEQKQSTRNVILFLSIMPSLSSFLIRVYAWMVLLQFSSIDILFSWKAIFIGQLYVYLPFMILPLYASVERLDRRLIRAAQDLGANCLQVWLHVVLPLIRPGMRTGMLFVFVLTFGDFVIADLLGGARLSLVGNVIKDQFLSARHWPFGSALAIVMVAVALIFAKLFAHVFLPRLPQEAR